MNTFDWPGVAVAVAGMAFIFGIVSRSKVSKEECEKRHEATNKGVGDLATITARLDERVKTLFSLQETQGRLMDRQLNVVENLERIVRENEKH